MVYPVLERYIDSWKMTFNNVKPWWHAVHWLLSRFMYIFATDKDTTIMFKLIHESSRICEASHKSIYFLQYESLLDVKVKGLWP